jgi:hypothetical protein
VLSALAVLAALAGAGCAPAAPAPPFVYVASGGDGTITRLDAGSGRQAGAAVSVGGAPRQLAAGRAGADDRLLVLGTDGDGASALTLVARAGDAWAEQPVVIEPGAVPSLVRSDGRRLAAVVYAPRPAGPRAAGPACRIALIDLRLDKVIGTHDLCVGQDSVLDLALGQSERGPAVYAAVWTGPRLVDGRWSPGVGRIVALQAETGRRTGGYPLGGVPGQVSFWQGHAARDRSLYVLESFPGSDAADGQTEHAAGGERRWQLLRLDPATLTPEAVYPLPHAPQPQARFAVAPEGGHAYVLVGHDAASGGAALLQVDLVSGSTSRFVVLPGAGVELAVAERYFFVTHPGGSEIWVIDRRERRLVRTVPVGRRPLAVTAAWP